MQSHFDSHSFQQGATRRLGFDAFDESHGRLVRHRVFASPEAATLEVLGDGPGLHTVLAIESIRSSNGSGQVEAEVRYFLSSDSGAPQGLAQTIRCHGSIENSLHGGLDMTFREDDCRVQDSTAARNVALLRKRTLNLVGQDRSTKASLWAKRKKAAWEDGSMQHLLKVNFMR